VTTNISFHISFMALGPPCLICELDRAATDSSANGE
jgi:hypothetical protein